MKAIRSSRGFFTYTGTFKGVPVSVVAIGMGPSMMDFFVRESRAIVEGPMAMIRFGTCGGLSLEAKQGKIAVARDAGYIMRNPDAFIHNYDGSAAPENSKPYHFHRAVPADDSLTDALVNQLSSTLSNDTVIQGTDITADSFYSSQGRIDDRFDDNNVGLIEQIKQYYPNAINMEMETYLLFHLAKCSRKPIKASAACMIVANRLTSEVADERDVDHLEEVGGRGVLEAIIAVDL